MADVQAKIVEAAKADDPRGGLCKLGDSNPHAVLRALASLQDGQFATAQAVTLGLTLAAVKWLRSSGETQSLRRSVWRFCSAIGDPDPAVTAWLACWPHATISHASAGVRHDLRGVDPPSQPELTVAHGLRIAPAGILVHKSRALNRVDLVTVGAVRYTTKARTICDLADQGDPWKTLTLVDDAIAAGVRRAWLHRRAVALADGRGAVRIVRDATAAGAAAEFRSWLERASSHVYRAGRLPEPEWNVPVYDEQGRIGIVDALWRPWRVVAEQEGLRFHTTPAQRRGDAERFNRLLDAEYAARRFTWRDVVERPVYVAATVARALRSAGADIDLARLPQRIDIPGWGGYGRSRRP
jgi:hypothetical protein